MGIKHNEMNIFIFLIAMSNSLFLPVKRTSSRWPAHRTGHASHYMNSHNRVMHHNLRQTHFNQNFRSVLSRLLAKATDRHPSSVTCPDHLTHHHAVWKPFSKSPKNSQHQKYLVK